MEVVIDTGERNTWTQGNFDSLLEELEYAQEHPFKVRLEFERRFRVWHDTLLRNRRLHVYTFRNEPQAQLGYISRYVHLDVADAQRLNRRVAFEFLIVANDTNVSNNVLIFAKNLYQQRQRWIGETLYFQLRNYESIGNIDIIQHLNNGWKELK